MATYCQVDTHLPRGLTQRKVDAVSSFGCRGLYSAGNSLRFNVTAAVKKKNVEEKKKLLKLQITHPPPSNKREFLIFDQRHWEPPRRIEFLSRGPHDGVGPNKAKT